MQCMFCSQINTSSVFLQPNEIAMAEKELTAIYVGSRPNIISCPVCHGGTASREIVDANTEKMLSDGFLPDQYGAISINSRASLPKNLV